MMKLLRDIPPIRSMPYAVDAILYNHARLALLRFGSPLEFELEKLAIDLVLENACWIGYCSYQVSVPLIAWDRFDTGRSSLDSPVGCTLHLYHHHAWFQLARVSLTLDKALLEQLSRK
jgi:hypothetical protein